MRKTAGAVLPLMAFDRNAHISLQAQIYGAFRSAVVARRLRAGDHVPSTRALALELQISRIPVLNAYAQLLAEGYFESRIGSGTFVCRSLPEASAPPHRRPSAVGQAARKPRIAARATLLPRYERPSWLRGRGAFNVSQPAMETFPLSVWSKLAVRYCRSLRTGGLAYGDPMGLMELREAVGRYLRAVRAVRCETEQIMITSGSQQALDITTRVLLEAGDAVWVEEPGYWLSRDMLASAGCRMIPVAIDNEGLDVAEGIARCPKARAAYVAPSHQYPLGATMSAARRLQLLDWAQSSQAWIVEDDYDSELRYDHHPLPSLQGLDQTGRVIYIGTFSKVLFPSLRIGYLVIPPSLVNYFVAVRHAMDVSPPHLSQAVLADFLNEGHFSRHLRRLRLAYSERRRVLADCLREEAGSLLELHGAEAGLHLSVTLRKRARDQSLSERAAGQNLWLWPLSPSYLGPSPRQGFILGFGGTTADEIPRAVHRLRDILTSPAAA